MIRKCLLAGLLNLCVLPALTAQTITNSGMEAWEDAPFPNVYDIEFPSSWSGSDKLIADNALLMMAVGITPQKQVAQSTDKYEGEYAARLETKFLGDTVGNLPALLVNAQMSLNLDALMNNPDLTQLTDLISFSGGTPVLGDRVDTVKAWVKLPATNEESASLVVTALQIVSGSEGQDTLVPIGGVDYTITASSEDYFEIAAPVTYADPNNTATDTVIIAFSSSAYTTPGQNVAGNTLFVDGVSMVTSPALSVDQVLFATHELQVYPNPSDGKLRFKINTTIPKAGLQLIVTDANGRVQYRSVLQQQITDFDFSAWVSGMYFYQITDTQSGKQAGGKWTIK